MSDNGNCPVCHLPSWVRDIHADYQMTSIVSTFKSLKRLLNEEKKNLSRNDVEISVDESHDQKSPDITTRKRHRQDDCVIKSKADSSLIKRNNRGETPLHVAALKVIYTLHVPYWRVVRRMCLYSHRKHICTKQRSALNFYTVYMLYMFIHVRLIMSMRL